MSILNYEYSDIDPLLNINIENKTLYGEVNTPFSLIENMLDLFPDHVFKNKNLKWLDIGAGTGNFSIALFYRLDKSLFNEIPDSKERKDFIIQHMIYLIEINPNSIKILKERFGENANIYSGDYLESLPTSFVEPDIIIGNPPYNSKGIKKVPTLKNVEKTSDGLTVWTSFVEKSIDLLKNNGYLNLIIPAIWLKPDTRGINKLVLKYKILKMHTINGNDANKLFNKNAQTPLVYFLLEKKNTDKIIDLYDTIKRDYIQWRIDRYKSVLNIIPLDYASIFDKIISKTMVYGHLKVEKTNMPSKKAFITDDKIGSMQYENIHTCRLKENKYILIKKYSDIPLHYYNIPKLVLSHKMYGIPYLDKEGKYGISNRDNYIIKDKSIKSLEKIKKCLESNLIIFLYNATRYRMKYLEKYIFFFLPEFSLIDNLQPEKINEFFNLTTKEIDFIDKSIKKKYIMD